MFSKPRKIVIHNYDPILVNSLMEKYGKPKVLVIEGDEVEMEW